MQVDSCSSLRVPLCSDHVSRPTHPLYGETFSQGTRWLYRLPLPSSTRSRHPSLEMEGCTLESGLSKVLV